jgi:hypothetical protein
LGYKKERGATGAPLFFVKDLRVLKYGVKVKILFANLNENGIN